MTQLTFLLPYLGRWDQFRKSRFHRITDRLADAGHGIHVIQAPETDSEEVTFSQRDIELPETVTLHDADIRHGVWDAPFANKVFQKGYYGVGIRNQVRRLIDTEDVDVLWLYNLPHYPIARIDDIRIVFDVVDDYITMLNHELGLQPSLPVRGVEEFVFAGLLKRASLITVISHELQRDVERMIGSSVPTHVVPNGVDTDVFSIQTDPPRTPQEPPVVGFVGSFEYFIDFDLILDAAEALPDVEFLLVGDGREYEYVESQLERRNLENVRLPGLVESSAVPEYIQRMDICLNSFKRTPLSHAAVPLKLFEYLSQGRPVISTRIREVEYIDDGFLAYADTASELVDAIERILTDYKAAVDRTIAASGLLEDTYNWDAIAREFEHIVTTRLESK